MFVLSKRVHYFFFIYFTDIINDQFFAWTTRK